LPEQVDHGNNPSGNGAIPPIETESLTESISDEARHDISRLMREEGGFRSSVSSAIAKIVRPEGMDSPGDEAIFQKLLKDKEMKSPPYSPKFTGMRSSSLIKQPRLYSASLAKSDPPVPSSPPRKQASWQTVDSQEPLSSPIVGDEEPSLPTHKQLKSDAQMNEDDEENWETLKSSSRPPPKKLNRKSSIAKLLENKHFSKAQAMWDQFQPRSRESSVRASVESLKNSLDPLTYGSVPPLSRAASVRPSVEGGEIFQNARLFHPLTSQEHSLLAKERNSISSKKIKEVDVADERDVPESIHYPQLLPNSSFTSHVSDHGRQPELGIEFDDTIGLDTNTPMALFFEDESYRPENATIGTDEEPELPAHSSLVEEEYDIYDAAELDLPIQAVQMEKKALHDAPNNIPTKSPKLSKYSSGSDDEFPSLDKLISQSQSQAPAAVKKEKFSPAPSKGLTKADKEYKQAMDAIDNSSDEDLTTPKASQKVVRPSKPQKRQSKPQVSKPLDSQERKSQPRSRGSVGCMSQPPARTSEPKHWNGHIPPGSQVMDLTMTSSDAEPEEDEAVKEIKVPNRFKKFDIDDSNDEDYEASDNLHKGKAKKRASSQQASRTHTSIGNISRGSSSQASGHTKRKTSSRF